MALALCLTLLPATAQAEDGHQTHPICGKTCSHTGETPHPDAFENANWLASSDGKLRVGSPGGSIYGASLTEKDNYVILNEGYYYLSYTADGCDHSYVRSLKTIKIEGDVTICLNGKQIEKVGSTTGPVFEVPDRSTLTLTDCTGNGQIMCDSSSNGSGVYVNGGILNLYSGQITKSEGQTDAKSNKYGGGVYVNSGNFNMYGGSITGNSANYGGGVYVKSGTFTMDGGDITRNSASYVGAGVYVEKNGNFIMNNDARVTENTIGYGSTGGSVYVNGGKFEMNGNASVTGNTAHNSSGSCGGGVYVNSGTFTMNGNASVTGNKATLGTLKGGGVYVEGGEFTMNGNSKVMRNAASGNKRIDGNGGGVYVKGGKFEMNGEETSVSNNTAATNGGGVYVEGGTFTMKGGTIGGTTDGEANTADQGGGVYVSSGTFTMSGGSITGNDGNGVFVHDNAATTFTVSGAPTVTGNTRNSAASNVFLAGSKTITIGDKLTGSPNSIGVTRGAYFFIANNVNEDYSGIFFSDNTQYKVEYDKTDEANHKLVLTKNAVSHTHKWEYTNVDKSTVSVTCKGASGSCDYTTTPATVTIRMAQPTYTYSKDMEAPKATLTYSDNWPKDVAKARESDITYWKSVDGSDTYTNMSDAPTAVGKYKASIIVGGQTASVVYEILDGTTGKQEQNQLILKSTENTLAVGETLILSVDGGSTNGAVTYHITSGAGNAELKGNVLTAKKAGTVTVTATMAGNDTYNNVTSGPLTITITEKSGGTTTGGNTGGSTGGNTGGSSSSGGSSSGGSGSYDSNPIIKTETKNNADGSTTKTETRKDGSVTQTTTGKDGSVSKTETKKDGSSVTENKAADGSTGTVKTDKHGQTEAKTALSNKAVEDAKKNGEAVKAPVEVEASRNSNTAPTVKVELPKGAGETKVEIPVSNVKSGTVAVLVHPDGTEEILKNSIPTEDGIQLTVDGNATVKIIDNSKGFIDTQDHWAKDAIDFVSARGLVNGMSATIYAPNNSTTRAQLWTILARQNDANLSGGNTWYESAQNWAKDKGVSDGANPNAAITRAQMVTMLWRTMGQPAATDKVSFADVPAGSYYAQAVAWAVESGITQGVGGGRFDPAATCTRAQIATFLTRLYAEK